MLGPSRGVVELVLTTAISCSHLQVALLASAFSIGCSLCCSSSLTALRGRKSRISPSHGSLFALKRLRPLALLLCSFQPLQL